MYNLAKHIIDWSARQLSKWLPALQADRVETALPPVVGFSPVLPQNIEQLPSAFSPFFRENVDFPATHLFTLHQVTVSWHAVILRNFRLFLPALAAPHWKEFYTDSYLLKQWVSKQATQPSQQLTALVHDQWTRSNYYHWIVDALPRLLVLRSKYPGIALIMPKPMSSYVEQTARLLGFETFLLLEEHEVLKAETLLVPEHVAPLGYHNPELLSRVRQEITTNLFPTKAAARPTRRIYVSRSRQHLRRLANEAEVLEIIQQHGFECVYFEEITFAEQVSLMRDTAVLMGVHGANLVNLVFMQGGAQVVELMNEDKFLKMGNTNFENLIYYRMSAILELPYFALPCQTALGQLPSNDADMVVDITLITQLMQQLSTT